MVKLPILKFNYTLADRLKEKSDIYPKIYQQMRSFYNLYATLVI
jgi:hypothetical protein